jgi:hypothetical protein
MGFYQDERWERLLSQVPAANTPAPALLTAGFRSQGFNSPGAHEQQWKATLQQMRTVQTSLALAQARALVDEYYTGYRELHNAIGKLVKGDTNEQYAVQQMFTAMSAVKMKVYAATTVEELKDARESFLGMNGCVNEYLAEPKLVEYEQMLDDQKRKDELAKSKNAIIGHRLNAHTRVREFAVKTAPIYTNTGQAICHMVSVAVDLDSGTLAEGRAGHKMDEKDLEPVFGFALPKYAATAFSTQNAYNCAELQALYVLKKQVPTLKMKNVYFAAMMPGGSPIIPPCLNCQRWIRSQGAAAAKMT